MLPPGTRLAVSAGISAALLPLAAVAAIMDWEKFADDPGSYIDKPVEVIGYCAQGGLKGDVDGYQCSTEGDLYISTPEIKPDFAKRKIEENCGGLDVVERSSFCRAKISFTPLSYRPRPSLKRARPITIISTDIATLKF